VREGNICLRRAAIEAAPLASGDQQRVQFEEVSALAQPLVRLVSGN
jgi:hypothetical protein